jgi:hypothetical protein
MSAGKFNQKGEFSLAWSHIPVIPAIRGGGDQEDHSPRLTPGKNKTLLKKYSKAKRARSMTQVIELLPSKLSSNL